jgi:phage regulator Rha-like protein
MRSQFVTALDNGGMWSQNATTSQNKRNTKVTPYAFTEHGVTMLASVLKSEKAIKMNIAIVRAFIAIKQYVNSTTSLNNKLNDIRLELKARIDEHDTQLNAIYDTLESLLDKKQDEEEQKLKWEGRELDLKLGKNKSGISFNKLISKLAERKGFEPSIQFPI